MQFIKSTLNYTLLNKFQTHCPQNIESIWWWYCSVTKLCPTLRDTMDCSIPGTLVPHHLPEFAQVHFHWISYAIQPSHPVALFSFCLHSFPASGSFSSESAVGIRWPKYWSFSIRPSEEYSGLISFKIDWFDLLVSNGPQESSQEHLLHLQYIRGNKIFVLEAGATRLIIYLYLK